VIDSHCHLALCEPATAELVGDARRAGVARMLTVGLGADTNPQAIADAEAFEEVFACVGHHPNSASEFDEAAGAAIEELAADPAVVAVGETGLDYFRDRAAPSDQRRAFEAQLGIARRVGKPIVIHMRDSLEDTFSVLREHAEGVEVILHCFSAGPEAAEEAAQRGWYCSFAGNVTYSKSDQLREAAALVPDHLLLVETDAPFLSPQPVRGKPNQPANVIETAERVAELRGITYVELDQLVEANARRVFQW
jgi:TatD DNase family protein